MPLKYNKVLIIGATSGIGLAYAEKVIEEGKPVVVVGRRKENLDEFVKKHGQDKADSFVFDISKLAEIPDFVRSVTKKHPDVDAVMLNSGMQRGFDFSNPETVDLSLFELELQTNYTAYIHLTKAFLPHLQKQENETALIYTSSGLALVPLLRVIGYSATKAALHHFVLVLREQMKRGPGNVKVVEIFPPAVQTELHDEKHQPDLKGGSSFGMPLKDFTEQSWAKFVNGDEQVPIGFVEGAFQAFENKRQEVFQQLVSRM
ncbi:short-chain dehydrogenase/ reductase-like protein [Periconia macrospinosa]|uniref:Short-chain dehydrogenase/ reductase-like protein n=1 Tax=Periconia macrospinosa TaxID=97972 RepID=A0A2V1DNM4_9PLEO|nr:short-chain dehydrogenase/ reductase-like protein [Periconia macrospinosa]